MSSWTPEYRKLLSAIPPSPVPSPPPQTESFCSDVELHYYVYGPGTRVGYHLSLSDSSPVLDWNLGLTGNFLASRGYHYSLRSFPPDLVPLFAYKDVAVYVPSSGANTLPLFDRVYEEWYPTRDRTVFNDGMLRTWGAPFFSSTIRCEFKDSPSQPPMLLKHTVRWHLALAQQLQNLLPRFEALKMVHVLLVRPGLTQAQLQALPDVPTRPIEYTPIIRRTFTECFMWVEKGWEDEGVRLVVLSEDMLRKILSGQCEGLTRDVDFEEQARKAAGSEVENEIEQSRGESGEHIDVEVELSMDHLSIWRGSLEDVMRAVVAGDETRKRGLREFNPQLQEWLGEGEHVGKGLMPNNE